MRKLIPLLTLSFAVLAPPLIAQSPPSPPPAAAAKPSDTSIAGKWQMSVAVESADHLSTLVLKLDGKKVSGAATAPSGEYPVTGEFTDGKLSFSINYQNTRLMFTGGLKDDGTLAGTFDWGEGPYNWKAERIKEK